LKSDPLRRRISKRVLRRKIRRGKAKVRRTREEEVSLKMRSLT